jgi:DNA-binding transcriptional LysR family regulator
MVRNTTSLLALVRAGVGVTVLPQLVIEGAEGDISFLPVADTAARRRIEILRRAHSACRPPPETSRMRFAAQRTRSPQLGSPHAKTTPRAPK